jgi:hypothetical protein
MATSLHASAAELTRSLLRAVLTFAAWEENFQLLLLSRQAAGTRACSLRSSERGSIPRREELAAFSDARLATALPFRSCRVTRHGTPAAALRRLPVPAGLIIQLEIRMPEAERRVNRTFQIRVAFKKATRTAPGPVLAAPPAPTRARPVCCPCHCARFRRRVALSTVPVTAWAPGAGVAGGTGWPTTEDSRSIDGAG